MDFLDYIITKDKELFVYLNAFGTENWDQIWLGITNQFMWTPLFLFFFILIFKAYGWKKGVILLLVTAALVTFSDQYVNFLKDSFQRLRPNNDPTINTVIRILKRPRSYSFVSGHACTSFAATTFIILSLRKHYKYTYFFLIWPILFSLSRIYVGVHFPLDITVGAMNGLLIGVLFYKLSLYFLSKFKDGQNLDTLQTPPADS
ncbi:phosphatase PAP2 family protein [Flavobacteriaceae bacterium F08102]|nr:phosphatase PAP2 family protein [Flavobacteriaceae bacterium F08102]